MAKALRSKTKKEPSLILRGEVWFFDFTVNGVRHKKSTGETDREKAMEIAKRAFAKAYDPETVNIDRFDASHAPASKCFRVYRNRRLKGRTEKVLGQHDAYVRRFHEFFGDPVLSELTAFRIEDWRDWLATVEFKAKDWDNAKTLSVKTRKFMLGWLASIYKYCKLANPVAGIERPKPELQHQSALDSTVEFWDDKMEAHILERARNTVFYHPLRILLYTGCRPAELRWLRNTTKEINREKHILTFVDKRFRVRGITLTGEAFEPAWDSIMEWIKINNIKQGEKLFPTSENWMLKRWHTVCGRAGITHCRLHQLRHQFVKRMFYTYDWSLERIAKWCGNSPEECARTYATLTVQTPDGRKTPQKIEILSGDAVKKVVEATREDDKKHPDAKAEREKVSRGLREAKQAFKPTKQQREKLARIEELERQLAELRQSV